MSETNETTDVTQLPSDNQTAGGDAAMTEAAKPKAPKPKPKTLTLTSRAKMGAARKTKPAAQAAKPAKEAPKAPAQPRQQPTLTQVLDQLMIEGCSWEKMLKRAKAEAEKRGQISNTTLGALKAHARDRANNKGWWVEMTDTGCRGNPPSTKPEKAQPKAKTPAEKREAKGLPPIVKRKNGKATGKKVEKSTEDGRQTVTEQATETEQAA